MKIVKINNRWLNVLKSESFKKVILVLICYCLLTFILIHVIGWRSGWLRDFIYGHNWQYVYKEHVLESIKLFIFLNSFFLPSLVLGLYFGIKKRGKLLFILPVLGFCGGLILPFILLFSGLFRVGDAESIGYFFWFFTIQSIWLAFFLILMLTFLKFKKEKIFLKMIIILSLFTFLINIGISKYFNKTANSNWCENKQITSGQDQYRDRCYYFLSLRPGDVQLCNKIRNSQEDCFADHALKLEEANIKICQMAKEKFIVDKCIKEIAVRIKDPSLCSQVELDFYQSNCYLEVAISKEDSNLCQFTSFDNRDRCYSEIGILKKDSSLCDLVEIGSYFHNRCISEIADELKDPDLCKKIKYESPRAECYKEASEN